MSRGPSQVTSTTQSQPSPFLTNAIGDAANIASTAFNADSPFGNPHIVDAQRFGSGLDALFARGQGGSPVVGSAQDLTQQTLQGDFLRPESNPFLQQTFDRAADLTRGRLDSEFSGSGRNLGASLPARSEELQTLASNIFGGNFQAERNRQAQAVNQAIPLANQDFADINAMLDSGNLRLDQLINRIQALAPAAGGTAISSQPVFRTGLFG